MFIVKHRKFFYALSIVLMVGSIVCLSLWGLKPSIDFKGGSLIEIEHASSTRPTVDVVRNSLEGINLGEFSVRETGESGYIIRTVELTPELHNTVLASL